MIKYAVIGRGRIVDTFIQGARLSGKLELAAVYSREEETGREYAVQYEIAKVYTDLNDLVNDKEIEDAIFRSEMDSYEEN